MICTYYLVRVYDKDDKMLTETKVYSFDEACYIINSFREIYRDAPRFEIVCPLDKRIGE
jgi:hypothetical protein